MLRAGIDSHRVQRILRHSDVRTTTGIYGHLLVEDLRAAVNAIAPNSGPFVTLSQAAHNDTPNDLGTEGKDQAAQRVRTARPEGVEPPTFGFEEREHQSGRRASLLDSAETSASGSRIWSTRVHRN
jgi:hypothetical protein